MGSWPTNPLSALGELAAWHVGTVFMKALGRRIMALVACCLLGGCSAGATSASGSGQAAHSENPVTRENIVGKWKLVLVGGHSPGALNIQSHELAIEAG